MYFVLVTRIKKFAQHSFVVASFYCYIFNTEVTNNMQPTALQYHCMFDNFLT